MTIALGILARDGVVVAADSQNTIPDYLKMSDGKIALGIQHTHSSFAITGAGHVPYLEYLRQSEVTRFLEMDPAFNLPTFEAESRSAIEVFHEKHVMPFAAYGSERPDVHLLMAVEKDYQRGLWYTDKNLLIPCPRYGAVGAGAMFARILLSRFVGDMDLLTAAFLAIYIVYQVKETVDGCGSETSVAILKGNDAKYLSRQRIEATEKVFQQYRRLESEALHYVLNGSEGVSQRFLSAGLRRLRREIRVRLTED